MANDLNKVLEGQYGKPLIKEINRKKELLARYKRKDAYTAESRTDKAARWRETMDTENKKKMEGLSPKEEQEFNQKLTFVR